MNPKVPFVSLVVVVRNGCTHIRRQLSDLLAIQYPAGCYEILVVDGLSEDGTRQIAEAFEQQSAGRIRVLENPKKILSAGWNIGVAASRGEVVLRVDVHCCLPPDYVRVCVARLLALEASGVRVGAVGGRTEMVAGGEGAWARAIAAAWNSGIGTGRPAYRTETHSGPVDTLALAVFPKPALQAVGGLDERLGRTEDNELFARLRGNGYVLYLVAETKAKYMVRASVPGLFRQMLGNGYWLIPTCFAVQKNVFSLRHFLPGIAAALGVVLLLVPPGHFLLTLAGLSYFLLVGIAAAMRSRMYEVQPAAVAWVILCMHAGYSLGTWYGALVVLGRGMRSIGQRDQRFCVPAETGGKAGGR